jgi:hypothetical protein
MQGAPHYQDVLAQISSRNKGGSTNYTSRYLAEEMAAGNSRWGNYLSSLQKEYVGKVFERPLPRPDVQEDYSKEKRYAPSRDSLLSMRLDYSLN